MPDILPPPTTTTAIDTVAIAAIVTVLCQFTKAVLPGDGWGPYVAIVLSAIATFVWVYSAPVWPPTREMAWPIFAAWANVLAASIGIYHGASLVTSGPTGIAKPRRSARPDGGAPSSAGPAAHPLPPAPSPSIPSEVA